MLRGEKTDEGLREWATEMLRDADFGDVRRRRRASEVLEIIAEMAGESLPKMYSEDTAGYEQAARYTRDDGTPPFEVLRAGCVATARQLEEIPGDIVVAGDTTTLSYSHASLLEELGNVGGPKGSKGKGILVHNALAVSANTGEVMGLVDQIYACRDDGSYGCKHERRERAYDEKESFKWEASFLSVRERLQRVASRTVFVNDREGDVYLYTLTLVDECARFVVRAQQNRRLETPSRCLRDEIAETPIMGYAELFIPQKGGRQARTARLTLRACSVTLRPPKHEVEALPWMEVNVVHLEEVDCPDGIKPVQWTLLTSEPIETIEDVLKIVKFYVLRWCVEEFHKCWKSDGTGVEDLRMQTCDNLLRIAIPMAFTAVRLMRLRDAHMNEQFHKRLPRLEATAQSPIPPVPQRLCTYLLSQIEWQTLWLKLDPTAPIPEKPPQLSWAMRGIARLAGWMDTKRTGRPGYRTLWTGWKKLSEAVDTVRIAHLLEIPIQHEM